MFCQSDRQVNTVKREANCQSGRERSAVTRSSVSAIGRTFSLSTSHSSKKMSYCSSAIEPKNERDRTNDIGTLLVLIIISRWTHTLVENNRADFSLFFFFFFIVFANAREREKETLAIICCRLCPSSTLFTEDSKKEKTMMLATDAVSSSFAR